MYVSLEGWVGLSPGNTLVGLSFFSCDHALDLFEGLLPITFYERARCATLISGRHLSSSVCLI